MRDRLIRWLLTSKRLCRLGLHMPVSSVEFTEDGGLREGARRCAACEKELPSRA